MPGLYAGHFAFERPFSHNSDTGDLMLPVSRPNLARVAATGFNYT